MRKIADCKGMMPIIISDSDRNRYIIAFRAGDRDELACDDKGHRLMCGGLQEAKALLHARGFHNALLKVDNAYDSAADENTGSDEISITLDQH